MKDFTKQVVAFDYPTDIVRAFTCGDCWLLALALNKLNKKLTLVTISQDKKGDWCHVAVELPNGFIVDIEGIWRDKEWLERWHGSYMKNMPRIESWRWRSNLTRSVMPIYRYQVFNYDPTEYANSILDRLRSMPEYGMLFS